MLATLRTTSPAARATIALVLGLAAGIAIASSSSVALRSAALGLESVGTIWVNAIRMTVIPLVMSLLIATIAREKDFGAVGRLGARAIAVFVALLTGIALIGVVAARPLFSLLEIDGASAASVRGASTTDVAAVQLPGFASWVVGLVPANPIKAASDGAMLPLIVFAVLFAAALARADAPLRTAGTELFRAFADAMLVIVGWVLALAPIGVFALAVGLAIRLGVGVAHAVVFFLAVHCGLLVVAGLGLYLVVRITTGIPLRQFAKAVLPAQVVAFSTRSSVAALPVMIESADRVLRLPTTITSFVLPFGVSLLRANTGTSWIVSAVFIGKLYGVDVSFAQVLLVAVTSIAMSFSVPGIPSAGLFIIAPVFLAIGLPAEGVGILIAVDSIPDIFKTMVNVTGHMTATAFLARGAAPAPALAGAPLAAVQVPALNDELGAS